jgi:hypothetical protein
MPSEITQRVPDDWRVGHRRTGWMTADVFYEYIGNIFALHFGKYNVKLPLILFVDGCRTHLSYQLGELCSNLGINLISVYPNATRLIQQVDVATFRPLILGLKTAVLEWHRQNSDTV